MLKNNGYENSENEKTDWGPLFELDGDTFVTEASRYGP